MCLGIPGRVVKIDEAAEGAFPNGQIDFAGIIKEACMAYVPEATIGDYVIVHAGFAISIIDAEQANEIFTYLKEMDEDINAELNPHEEVGS
jgi:hydrogenase expression/formation protein HypC